VSDWLRGTTDGVTLTLHIQPGAKTTEITGLHGDALKIRLASPPVDGKANAALIDFVAGRLGVPRSHIEIRSGHASRRKVLAITGVKLDQTLAGLAPAR